MSDPEEPIMPPEGISLGLSGRDPTGFDSSLTPSADPADAPLDLPQNGMVALRKSGGMRFTSRAVTVLRSGWAHQQPHAEPPPRPRRVTPAATEALRRLALRARLGALPDTVGTPSPDAYAYELATRIGRRVHRVTVYDGSIPARLEPLIRALSRLLPER